MAGENKEPELVPNYGIKKSCKQFGQIQVNNNVIVQKKVHKKISVSASPPSLPSQSLFSFQLCKGTFNNGDIIKAQMNFPVLF